MEETLSKVEGTNQKEAQHLRDEEAAETRKEGDGAEQERKKVKEAAEMKQTRCTRRRRELEECETYKQKASCKKSCKEGH